MLAATFRTRSIAILVLGALASLALPLTGYAQCCGGGSGSASGKGCCSGEGGSSDKPSMPDPFGGQVFCPVTGEKLGVKGAPVRVETPIGSKKPSFLGKLAGKKPSPGVVLFVCCQDCVAKVQSDPETYVSQVIADKGSYRGTYASAPASKYDPPAPAVDRLPGNPAPNVYGGQKTCPVTGKALGAMGPPVPVVVKEQTIYVCCQGCVAKVQGDPDTYLSKVEAECAGH